MRWYVGADKGSGKYEAFQCSLRPVGQPTADPSEENTGQRYRFVIGPFKTLRGAAFMADHGGQGNPHLQHVDDAERLVAALDGLVKA